MTQRSKWPSVADLCRMDGAMVDRIAKGQGLFALIAVAGLVILIGGGLYGYAFGLWRSPTQGLFSAVKLPLLLFAVITSTVLINGLLASVLHTKLNVRQSVVCVLLALAISAALLGALSPVSIFFVLHAPPPAPGIEGLEPNHPLVVDNLRVAQLVLAFHIVVVAICGVVGNIRLFQLLIALTGSRVTARRLLVSWLLIDGFVGAQLSWLLRPFLCKPNLEPQMIRPDAFRGNFFEEIWRILTSSSLGASHLSAILVIALLVILLALLRAFTIHLRRPKVTANLGDMGLRVKDRAGRTALIPFGSISTIGPPIHGLIDACYYLDLDLIETIAFLPRQTRIEVSHLEDAKKLHELISNACVRALLPAPPYR